MNTSLNMIKVMKNAHAATYSTCYTVNMINMIN